MSCLFCKILDGSIPSTAVYQDGQCYAFADIHPQAPVHVLIVPRKHLDSVADAEEEDKALLGHLFWAGAEIARAKGISKGYRLVVNTGEDGGQTVDHLHVHLLGGRPMTWPPG
jgi:histidine triad (HIT) family protein